MTEPSVKGQGIVHSSQLEVTAKLQGNVMDSGKGSEKRVPNLQSPLLGQKASLLGQKASLLLRLRIDVSKLFSRRLKEPR